MARRPSLYVAPPVISHGGGVGWEVGEYFGTGGKTAIEGIDIVMASVCLYDGQRANGEANGGECIAGYRHVPVRTAYSREKGLYITRSYPLLYRSGTSCPNCPLSPELMQYLKRTSGLNFILIGQYIIM